MDTATITLDQISPRGNRCIVQLDRSQRTSDTGLVYGEAHAGGHWPMYPQVGIVRKVGPGIDPSDLEVGDRVMCTKHNGVPCDLGPDHILIKDDFIIAVILGDAHLLVTRHTGRKSREEIRNPR